MSQTPTSVPSPSAEGRPDVATDLANLLELYRNDTVALAAIFKAGKGAAEDLEGTRRSQAMFLASLGIGDALETGGEYLVTERLLTFKSNENPQDTFPLIPSHMLEGRVPARVLYLEQTIVRGKSIGEPVMYRLCFSADNPPDVWLESTDFATYSREKQEARAQSVRRGVAGVVK